MSEKISEIRHFYEESFHNFNKPNAVPEIEVRFYPYIGIKHTIRRRDDKIFVRLAELCREMPLAEHRALARILTAKILRKKVPADAKKLYTDYIKTRELRESAEENKRRHGRKIITSAQGHFFDLDEIFIKLNAEYFRKTLPQPVLTWSARKTYRILGHHDATHETIVISKSLDDRNVPEFVVEYVVFHEMLHIHHPTMHRNGRRYNHTPEFKRDERKFLHFEAAERWIEENVKQLKKKAKNR
jgi:hypothetical protein